MDALSNPLKNLVDNLDIVLNQIKDGESKRKESSEFNLEQYWKNMDSVYKVISKEATKMCIAYSQPPIPSPSDCQTLVTSMEQAVLTLVSIFYSLPKTQGLRLRKRVRTSVISVLEGVKDLLEKIVHNGQTESPEMQRQATGNVWQCCDSIQSMPKDNKLVSMSIIKETEELIKDVIQELNEGISNQGSCFDEEDSCNEDSWSDAERTLVTSCLGLVKVVKTVLKKVKIGVKTNGGTTTDACRLQYDDLADLVDGVSPVVDQFVASLYPPVQCTDIATNAEKVVSTIESLLEFFKSAHFYMEEDSHWISFLQNATVHNMQKITQNISSISNT